VTEQSVFHQLVGDLDYPMVVVTAAAGGRQAGCLVGFSTQCSIDPARYVVFISKQNFTFGVARQADHLAVHLLSKRHHDVAALFGETTGDDHDKFADVRWHGGPGGAPVLDDVGTWFVGRVVDHLDGGDHLGFVLEPLEAVKAHPVEQLGFQDVKGMDPGHEA
jgi:flavin reductase (DIM6/NTAB) family NADH-FMN oxidoreductase RutF